jgi:hypothetical protein
LKERSINLTLDQASTLMVVLSETPTILARMKKISFPCTEQQLLEIVDKARKLCVDFHVAEKLEKPAVQQPLSKTVERESWRCHHCGGMTQTIEGDCPAGRWGWTCGNCGKKV